MLRPVLRVAIKKDLRPVLRTVFALGVDINKELDRDGSTALMLASQYGTGPVIEMLASMGADPNVSAGRHGQYVIHLAARHYNYEALRQLVRSGAAVDMRSREGETALAILADYARHLSHETVEDVRPVVTSLGSGGAATLERIETVTTAVPREVVKEQLEAVDCLVSSGADVDPLAARL